MARPSPTQVQRVRDNIDLIGEDLLQNILTRLPALSFAYAACVSRSWNLVCDRILSRPKLSSAFSLNPSLQVAVEEVLNKVLSSPIRPHFAIAYIAQSFCLQEAHHLITAKLGSTTPVITSVPYGIIGRDALTNEFKEIQWEITEDEDIRSDASLFGNRAIALTVGYLPGLKVDAIPLLQSNEEPPMVEEFVMDIRDYTASVSGCTSPAGIIMFADRETDMKPVLEKMDYAMSPETVIVGDGSGEFLYRGDCTKNTTTRNNNCSAAAVAILFTRDRDKPHGIGETQFHVSLSTGVSPMGPTYKAVSVREKRDECSTWLTARREGVRENLDGQTILNHIYDELGDRIQYPAFYIGVSKRRKCSIGLEKVKWMTSLAFHEVLGGDEEYLFVGDTGIKTGDSFRFYYSNSNTALSSCRNVSDNLRLLKQDCNHENSHHLRVGAANGNKKEVFGGIIFSCCGRGESFLGQSNVDSTLFLENFPGVTLAGSFCGGEIGRGDSSSYNRESQELGSVRCCMHVFSSVYLVMSYTPSLSKH